MSSINLQESQSSGCETYIAIVVDESGSINGNEAQQIRDGLTSFINSQAQSKITLSLIGMSNSDSNTRSEHVLQKRILGNAASFQSWVNGFGLRSADPQSDHWASGLEVVNNLTVIPDIVVVVTDGLQVNDNDLLKNLYNNLNDKSHVFVYGVTSTVDNAVELLNPLTSFLGKAPAVKTGGLTMLSSDYIRVPDFSTLGTELNQLAGDLSSAQIGCLPNVSIVQNKMVYPSLKKGFAVHQNAGTLVLRNKSRVAQTITAGTRIHNPSSVGGLVFKLENTVVIPGLGNLEVAIRMDGTPVAMGNFTSVIDLRNVNNPGNVFQIGFNVGKEIQIVDITSGKTALQSTSLQITAAGSKGIDSTKGIHLRWLLAGELGENHLPKGDLFKGTNSNFNKTDDFVKVYRAAYTKVKYKLDLTKKPQSTDTINALWVYKTSDPQRSIYVYFRNKAKYLSTKASINPMLNPSAFIQAYGNNIIEVENKSDLFFAAELNFGSAVSSSVVKIETLSVAENKIAASKRLTNRRTITSTQVSTVRVIAENGRSIRLKANNCLLSEINFEFYSDFIQYANENGLWDLKGKYALTLDDNKAFEQLEPKLNSVHGKWLKFNDDEYVDLNNYKDKWRRVTSDDDKNIKEVVTSYIELSLDDTNPKAEETIEFNDSIPTNDPKPDETAKFAENSTKISNLDLLNIAANDYHIARMLGLGCIDIDETVLSGEFIYLTEYVTLKNLEGDSTPKEVQHLSMSIPTSVNTERLPLPVQLSKFLPGLNAGSEEEEQAKITDPDGYSFDGKKRYISLFMNDITDYSVNTTFFDSTEEFDGSSFTFPIYAGVDYKFKGETNWQKPELACDTAYYNIKKDLVTRGAYEPAPIIIPESGKSFLNVRQEKTGEQTYVYQGYGINIFSRATSGRQLEVSSHIKPKNTLLPPTGINPLLITEENPLMFTSVNEQIKFKELLDDITVTDKTYIRLLFENGAIQETQNYTIPDDMSTADALLADKIYPDNEELFADYFKVYYRDSLPQVEHAKIESITDSPTNELTSIIKIKEYKILSSGEEIKVNLTEENKSRFIGGILTVGELNYIIQNITVVNTGEKFAYANIQVLKKEVSDSLVSDGDATIDSDQIKDIKTPVNDLCTIVENMLTPENWNQPSPLNFKVQVPQALKTINREIISQKDSQGNDTLQIEKTRGIWRDNVLIEEVLEKAYQVDSNGQYILDDNEEPILLPEAEKKHFGLYKLTFNGYELEQHPQYTNEGHSVEWMAGSVRLFTDSCFNGSNPIPVKSRKEFKVVKTESKETTGELVVYINDPNFKIKKDGTQLVDPSYDKIITGTKKVNYYPGYKVYLFADPSNGITAAKIQPREGENTHYSIFGISSHSNYLDYDSRISVPSPMYAVRIEKPVKPEDVKGPLYATRPDFFNRSTYTLTTRYTHQPYGMLYYRANDQALLNALYKTATIATIREALNKLGGNNEAYFTNRWENFLDFNGLQNVANYAKYPPESISEENYHFPVPDSELLIFEINEFIKWHNAAQNENVPEIETLSTLNQIIIPKEAGIAEDLLAIHFIEQVIHSTFVPLTEVPIIYEYIKGEDYVPVNKKQTIKDKDGNVLKYPDPELDIAPMMKITDATHFKTQFTDFNLDGNSQDIYFYGVREMDIKLNFSEFSTFLGPVKLVASNPPQTPEIKRIMPVLENEVLGIKPAIQIELNAYKPEYKIRKINIYRAKNMLDAQSIRTMTAVKEILITEDTLSTDFNSVWTVYDEFDDLENIPFGEGIFYRITVSREIEYADPSSTDLNPIINIDYTPSQPSKITATVIADTVSPESPVLTASIDVSGENESVVKPVVFSWEKTVHNGKYHLYKMNNQGNWDKIQEKVSNEETVILTLLETKLATDELIIKNADDERIYHHFKVIAENSSGMYSSEEKILTL